MSKQHQFDCNNLEEALREGSPEAMESLELHSQTCAACRTELVLWQEISAAARTMKKEWPSPGLWPRISEALETENAKPRGWRSWIRIPSLAPALRWQGALAALAVVMIAGATMWVMSHRYRVTAPDNQHLLTDQAVAQVEDAQRNYEQSIDKLDKLAKPKLAASTDPLTINYREKLELLDGAIAECRANLEKNQANAYLRHQLLDFYQEKQKTLEQVLRED